MDLFQRTCIKEGVIFGDIHADEEEVFEADSGEFVEEEQAPEPSESELDLDALYQELECMKKRIQKIQLMLKMKDMEPCPEEECMDYEVLLNCSENREICALQKGQYKLQCQIEELIRCCKYAKDQIADLRSLMCKKHMEILELQKMVAVLDSWRMTLEHEFGLCLERFEYIKHVKAEWSEVWEKLEKQRKCLLMRQEKYVPKVCYTKDKIDFVNATNDLRTQIQEVFEYTKQRFDVLEMKLFAKDVPEQTEMSFFGLSETTTEPPPPASTSKGKCSRSSQL